MIKRRGRRSFLKAGGGAAAALAATSSRVLGAGDRLRVAYIGVGNRGSQLLASFSKNPQVETAALCDVDAGMLQRAKGKAGGAPALEKDFRAVLARNDVDAVVISTPDHWHALQMIAACEAGKDVYVEKPLSITVVEGRKMVAAARRYARVVQVGIQRRSSEAFRRAREFIGEGALGTVTVTRAYRLSNMHPAGIGRAPDAAPPPELDWDLWLGPRPARPFRETIHPYKFRWWDLYSSQVANWGVHYFDGMRWLAGAEAPVSVSGHGTRAAVADDRTIPDTVETIHELPSGCLVIFGQYEASGNPAMRGGDLEIRGSRGTMYVRTNGYEIVPERGGQFQDPAPRMQPVNVETAEPGDATDAHVRNFLECIHNRRAPSCDIETGHRSTSFALLANIALAVKARLEWDAAKESITAPGEANRLLHYEYRAPWKLPD
ncbi:MAG TPA: Gfo/Idh/MocA family oxidoreductase [Planctomycetota bacterium]|jgi:predicted dehydrogenase|nr:Gfo/Idh/MocA family oxidoreductase [Planctomycetota bacterium]OQC20065.1 MAG: Inositol 2-dehydrogenase [Planctomycetes bacterium ADurb.Bin069]NMD37029.1 Gfo/Idh/MocA family oxidoreductase [Planctomycetota bacterium]HNR98682.1 Gfo/Idh/MocA family oxidoreductase [Planctomycetota bacterium]HNU25062.1 Gfo/Idh/MocA family oxidoreductase [Planctomycetota bacterium]